MISKSKIWRSFAWLMSLQLLFIGACAAGPVHFRRSYTVANEFENYQLLPGYQYYYNGLPYSPDAVVAIRKGYTLKSPHWHPVKLDARKLGHMVAEMLNNPGAEYNTDPNGAYILNNQGDKIGVWYSVWALPLVTFTSKTELSISQPMTIFPYSNRDPERSGFPFLFRGP